MNQIPDSDNNNNIGTDDIIDAGKTVSIDDEENFEFDSAIRSSEIISENEDNINEDSNEIADNSTLMFEICLKIFTNTLRKAQPEKIRQFERDKGGTEASCHGMGGTYHGPDCRRIISEEWLAELTSKLNDTSLSRPIVR